MDVRYSHFRDYKPQNQGWQDPEWQPFAQRSIFQIIVKTIFTHAMSIANYGQLIDLLNVPTKYNVRLIHIILFAVLPTLLLGEFAWDLVKGALRILQNPHELDIEATNAKSSYLMIFEGILGKRARPVDSEDDTPARDSTSLLEIPNVDYTATSKAPWTAIRIARITLTFVALLLSIAGVVLFARRSENYQRTSPTGWYSKCTTRLDYRVLWAATGSIAASVVNLYLLSTGVRWVYNAPVATTETMPQRSGVFELQRLAVEFCVGAFLQEFIALKTYMDDSGAPHYPVSLVKVLDHLHLEPLEVILIIVVVLIAILFRNDLASRLGIKLRTIYTVLTVVFVGWFALDTLLLTIFDIGDFLLNYDSHDAESWADPWEKWIPFI